MTSCKHIPWCNICNTLDEFRTKNHPKCLLDYREISRHNKVRILSTPLIMLLITSCQKNGEHGRISPSLEKFSNTYTTVSSAQNKCVGYILELFSFYPYLAMRPELYEVSVAFICYFSGFDLDLQYVWVWECACMASNWRFFPSLISGPLYFSLHRKWSCLKLAVKERREFLFLLAVDTKWTPTVIQLIKLSK